MKSCSMDGRLNGFALLAGTAWVLAAGGPASGQAAAPVGVAKPAEYDCAGLEGAPLTSCRELNAAAIKGVMVNPAPAANSTHDCRGMSGAALTTCLDLNGQLPAGAAPAGGGSIGGAGYGTALSNGAAVAQPAPGNALVPGAATPIPQQTTGGAPGPGATTPIPQQTTGGTNPITPSGRGTTPTTGGNNPIAPSGAGVAADGSSPGMIDATGTPTQPVPASSTPAIGVSPGAPQVSPPTDRVAPLAPAAPNRGPAGGAVRGGAGGQGSK